MSKIGLVVLLSLYAGRILAQPYFVFIGSDNRQPFYVRLDSQFYSSSPEGHLILGRLADSSYTLTVGFPGQIFPERQYVFGIHRKDQEFQLKKQDDGSWKLYDVLGKDWVTVLETAAPAEGTRSAGIKKDDAFSRMMAALVHDTAVLYNTYAMEQALSDSPAVASSPASALAPDTAATTKANPDTAFTTNPAPDRMAMARSIPSRRDSSMSAKANPAPDSATPYYPGRTTRLPGAGVVKLSEKRSSRALRQVYADQTGAARADTIIVIIPVDTARTAIGDLPRSNTADTTRPHPAETLLSHAADIPSTHRADAPSTHPADTPQPTSTHAPMPYVNSDCHNFATEYDVDKLRVKLLDAVNDDDRIAQARKVFKTKCFYTSQVSALSEVFTTDAAKFRFFQTAWPFAPDEHFHQLSALLHDPVYIAKFNEMTGQH